MKSDNSRDHRIIARNLDLYFSNNKVGQGLLVLLPNWVIIRNKISEFLQKKQKNFGFQEVITPILGNEKLYKTSGHLTHYQNSMFPPISCNNETFFLRPMTCPHHCLIYQQKLRSYRELPFRLCENSFLHRYETSGSLKGLERLRYFELADHHIFTTPEQLKEEFKKNYYYISEILASFNFQTKLICALHDPNNLEKYHLNQEIWEFSEKILIESLNELKLEYVTLDKEAAFYGPKLDFEIRATDGKNITIATIQLDFISPQKFGLNYLNKERKKQIPIIIHQSPFGSYQRFIALLLEQTNGKLPFWLTPCQVAILPLNDEKEIQTYSQELVKFLNDNNLRVEILSRKTLKNRIHQIYQRKIPYYLVIGKEEMKKKTLKLTCTYQTNKTSELSIEKLVKKLKFLDRIQ